MERGKLKRVHHVSNISTALKFLEMKKVNFQREVKISTHFYSYICLFDIQFFFIDKTGEYQCV